MTGDKSIIENLQREKDELNLLIGMGYEFTVDIHISNTKKSLFGIIKRSTIEKVQKTYRIEEPTLGTLDRLSTEWVELAIDEERMKSSEGMSYAMEMVSKHARRCAKIVALAVIGSEYEIPVYTGGAVRYKQNIKRLDELTDVFVRSVKPSDLYKLIVMISAISNLGDFVNSIRLMSPQRTSAPSLVEEEEG